MNASSIRKTLATAAIGLAGVAATGAAQAGVSWHIGINLPGPVVVAQPPVVYYEPPPVVYAPAPVVYQPVPVYHRPHVVHRHHHYHQGKRGHWHKGHWRDDGHRHGHRGWRDRDDDDDDRRGRHHHSRYRY